MADLTYFWDKSDLLIVSYLWMATITDHGYLLPAPGRILSYENVTYQPIQSMYVRNPLNSSALNFPHLFNLRGFVIF